MFKRLLLLCLLLSAALTLACAPLDLWLQREVVTPDAMATAALAAPTNAVIQASATDIATAASIPSSVKHLVVKVLAQHPHDPTGFTEGLVWANGTMYESSGLYGTSSLRAVDAKTGKILHRGKLEKQYFAEGLALVGDSLIQLTWNEKTAFVYNAKTFTKLRTFTYAGEGWGLCYDGTSLYMSNGSSAIAARDPKTFAVQKQIQVLQDNNPVVQINELECVGDSIYANVWMTTNILQIDKATGQVLAVIDASSLIGMVGPDVLAKAGPDAVLNGIAYDPTDKTFWITGKLWPTTFEVQFVPQQ